jgi:hypothetical protein
VLLPPTVWEFASRKAPPLKLSRSLCMPTLPRGGEGTLSPLSFCTSLVPHLPVSVFALMARNVSEIGVKNRNLCGSGCGGGSGGGL